MSALILGYNNQIDAAVLSGGNWSAGLPLANLQQRNLMKKARSADLALASATFDLDLGVDRAIRVASLCNHNLSAAGRFRVRASRTAGAFGFRNDLVYSEQFDNAAWIKTGTLTVTPNAGEAPDGGAVAELLADGDASNPCLISQSPGIYPSGSKIACGIEVKQGTSTKSTFNCFATGDTETNAYVTWSGGVPSVTAGTVTTLGGGWYLWTLVVTTVAAAAFQFRFWPCDRGVPSATGNVYVNKARCNPGDVLQPYEATTAAANPGGMVFSSGWCDAWPAVYDLADLRWEDDNFWSGRPPDAERAGQYANTISPLIDWVNARYWRVEVDDQRNPAGYIEMGRMFLGPGFQPAVNMSYGAALAVEPNTPIDTAMGGREFFDRRPGCRVSRFSVDWMTIDEGLRRAYELERQMGNDLEVFLILDPDDLKHAHRRNFLGRLRQLSALEFPYYNTTRKGFEIKELL